MAARISLSGLDLECRCDNVVSMEPGLTTLIRLGKDRARPAADVLTRAFQNYAALKYYYPDDRRRFKANRYYNLINAFFGIHYGEMYASSENLEGIAVWIRAAQYNMNFWHVVRAVPILTLGGFILADGWRTVAMGAYADAVHRRVAPFDHWYLFILGVDPPYQGRGFASRLLRPALMRADRARLPCYLETNEEVDVAIYRHFGFRVVAEGTVPGTTIKNWAMLRNAGGMPE